MHPSPSRHTAAFTVILLALGFLAGCAPAHIGTTVSASLAENQAGSTVVVGCSGQQQNRPASLVLTCADANDALTALAENGLLVAGAWLIGYAVTQQRAYRQPITDQRAEAACKRN